MSDAFEPVASGFFRLVWGQTSLMSAIREGDARVKAKVMSVLEYKAPAVETYAKTNAPWEDQTGNARQGLRAQAFDEGDNMGIVLYGQVPYQIWLEIAHSGQYAIIGPTIQAMGPEVMRSLERILGDI